MPAGACKRARPPSNVVHDAVLNRLAGWAQVINRFLDNPMQHDLDDYEASDAETTTCSQKWSTILTRCQRATQVVAML